ncbi:MAG TPA: fibronectin type III domain-containing protein [Bryobacteraceae bacterium]|nr:fibronectin type III domain-containing protein [Bryobacteraceae bacterium]
MISEKNNPVGNLKTAPEAKLRFASHPRLNTPPPVRKGRIVTVGIVLCLLAGLAYFMRSGTRNKPALIPAAENITADSATIRWATVKPLASQVEYGPTPAYGRLSEFYAAPVTSHAVTLRGLKPGTTYNYSALSTDTDGQVTRSANTQFTTTGVGGAPVSHVPAATAVTANSATITWTTDQPLTSQVEFGTTPTHGSLSAFSAVPMTAHSVTLTGLKPGTTYNYATLSTNSAGQTAISPNATFTTAAVAGAPVVGAAQATDITTTSARITWTTDELSASQVEYGATPSYGLLSAFNATPTKSHSVLLTGLIPGTTYYFASLSASSSGQVGASANSTFMTAKPGGGPAITGVATGSVTTTSAKITWNTDQPAASQIQYGTTPAYGLLSTFNPSLATSHAVTLTGLTPGLTYNYTVLSTNATGQVGKSANFTFTAGSGPPVISKITATRITDTGATITWTTDQPSSSQVRYGQTSFLWSIMHRHRKPYTSESAVNSTLVKSHSVALTGLTPGTSYNLAVVSANSGGMQNISSNIKFSTGQ